MGIGFLEISLLAWLVAVLCFTPLLLAFCQRGGLLFVGSLSLLVMFGSVIAELAVRSTQLFRQPTH